MSQDLGGYLSRYSNWVYSTLEARFYNCGDYAGLRAQQGDE